MKVLTVTHRILSAIRIPLCFAPGSFIPSICFERLSMFQYLSHQRIVVFLLKAHPVEALFGILCRNLFKGYLVWSILARFKLWRTPKNLFTESGENANVGDASHL